MSDKVLFEYTGNGAFLSDVPARSIREDETEFHASVEANIASAGNVIYRRVQGKAKRATQDAVTEDQ